MVVLPIKSVREEDGILIGQDLLNLARLAWANLPVAAGVVVTPPTLSIKTVLEHFQLSDREIFEQRLHLVRQQILNIPVPEELKKSLPSRINANKLWHHLLEFWLSQIRSRIWREGFSPDLLKSLTAQPVFFTTKIKSTGSCFYDYDRGIAIFETQQGQPSDEQKEEIEQLVKQADKQLFGPQLYDWILEKGIQIVKVSPITSYPEIEEIEQDLPRGYQEKKSEIKPLRSTLKVFLQADQSLRTGENIDGVLVCSETNQNYDQKLLQLIEYAQIGEPVVFKFFDEKGAKVRGSLNLIHKKELLEQEAGVVKFLRNKKFLNNVQVGIPLSRSSDELKKIKQELSSLGLSRGGSLKIWLELAVVENFLNLEDYLQVGFDGALLNLDQLAFWIGGFDPAGEEAFFYSQQVMALEKLLQPALKLLHKEGVLTLAYGSLALHDDLLSYLMDNGIYAIAVDYVNSFSIQERLRLIERRIIRSRVKEQDTYFR